MNGKHIPGHLNVLYNLVSPSCVYVSTLTYNCSIGCCKNTSRIEFAFFRAVTILWKKCLAGRLSYTVFCLGFLPMLYDYKYIRDGVEGDLVAKAVELVDDGVVGVEMGEEEGHGDAASVGVHEVLETKIKVVVQVRYGIVEGQNHELGHVCYVKAAWKSEKDDLLQRNG